VVDLLINSKSQIASDAFFIANDVNSAISEAFSSN